MWPITLPNGWRLRTMAARQRSVHVRRHLLNAPEKWHEISSLSRSVLRTHRENLEAQGCRCGPKAEVEDAPGAPGHAEALELFVRDYQPIAFIALSDALEAPHAWGAFEEEERSFYVVTEDHLVVVCAGSEVLSWRTAYRLTGDHRRRARPEVIHQRHLRALKYTKALARSAPGGPS